MQPKQRLASLWGDSGSSSSSSTSPAVPSRAFGLWHHVLRHSTPHRLPLLAAADSSGAAQQSETADAAVELPLWRFLQQQGFSADGVSRMRSKPSSGAGGRRASISGSRMSEERVQRDVAPNIAALRAEGLDTATIERIFELYQPC